MVITLTLTLTLTLAVTITMNSNPTSMVHVGPLATAAPSYGGP